MKVIIKQTDWNSLKQQKQQSTTFEYLDDVLNCKNFIVVKKENSDIVFAFKIIKKSAEELKLAVYGSAGGVWSNFGKRFKPRKVVLKPTETLEFNTKTLDSGTKFEMSLEI